jgi:hypothetical protein
MTTLRSIWVETEDPYFNDAEEAHEPAESTVMALEKSRMLIELLNEQFPADFFKDKKE